jgi:hypothetical protein
VQQHNRASGGFVDAEVAGREYLTWHDALTVDVTVASSRIRVRALTRSGVRA